MNAASSAPDEGLMAEWIAPGGEDITPASEDIAPGGEDITPGGEDITPGGEDITPGGEDIAPASEDITRGGDGRGSARTAGADGRARLFDGDELQRIVIRWKEIQAQFVDEPRTAVEQADALVADLVQQLSTMFAGERAGLEQRWAGGNEVSTEELRQSLRRYRFFFERLLAA